MRKLTKILIGFLFAILLSASWVDRTEAQFLGYIAGQTVTKTFSVSGGTPTPKTTISVTNNGQSGHTLQVNYAVSSANCLTILQGSQDGTNFITLAAVPNTSVASPTWIVYATGYFPIIQIVVNANNKAGCTTTISGVYTGYQFPISNFNPPYSDVFSSITTSVTLLPNIEAPGPAIIEGFACFNPNASTAFLQIGDSNPPPAGLGNFILYQIGIPAGATVVDPSRIFAGNALSVGASTTAGGNTAVATGLACTFKVNPFGPFGQTNGAPNRY